jgi:hypothetical protein
MRSLRTITERLAGTFVKSRPQTSSSSFAVAIDASGGVPKLL